MDLLLREYLPILILMAIAIGLGLVLILAAAILAQRLGCGRIDAKIRYNFKSLG